MLHNPNTARILALVLLASLTVSASAQGVRHEHVLLDRMGKLTVRQGQISGHEIVDYRVAGERAQILSVDLLTTNAANHFNVMRSGSNEALFIGSTQGTVADVRLPEHGVFIVRVYLARSAANQGLTARYSVGISLGRAEFADGLAGGPDYWKVTVDSGSALNLRAGPSTRYQTISRLRNGDVLQNRRCRMTGDERWCAIRGARSGVMGWVAGRDLVESGAPRRPATTAGGPAGNGQPFGATGFVSCAVHTGQPMRQCPFGVIRQGPGNAGIWIAVGDGRERHILFERGIPVAAGSTTSPRFEKTGDLFMIHVGDERFEIPEAVVSGG